MLLVFKAWFARASKVVTSYKLIVFTSDIGRINSV